MNANQRGKEGKRNASELKLLLYLEPSEQKEATVTKRGRVWSNFRQETNKCTQKCKELSVGSACVCSMTGLTLDFGAEEACTDLINKISISALTNLTVGRKSKKM